MKQLLPESKVSKLFLDSSHDATPYFEYCRDHKIIPSIDFNADKGQLHVYNDDLTINNDSTLVCREGYVMCKNGTEGQSSNVPESALPTVIALMLNMAGLYTLP